MNDEKKDNSSQACGCTCDVESIITIDERGQVIIPKELREKAGFHPGDKLALISWSHEGEFCSLTVMKTDVLAGYVQEFIQPMNIQSKKTTKGDKKC